MRITDYKFRLVLPGSVRYDERDAVLYEYRVVNLGARLTRTQAKNQATQFLLDNWISGRYEIYCGDRLVGHAFGMEEDPE